MNRPEEISIIVEPPYLTTREGAYQVDVVSDGPEERGWPQTRHYRSILEHDNTGDTVQLTGDSVVLIGGCTVKPSMLT